MLNEQKIVERIRAIAKHAGLASDAAICKECKFGNRMVLKNLTDVKTSPRIDTLAKFAKGLNVSIEDLIYERSAADMELSRLINSLSDYEKTKVAVYIEMMIAEKKKNDQPMAA